MGTVFMSLEADIARLSGELDAARAANTRLSNENATLRMENRTLDEENARLSTDLRETLAELGRRVRQERRGDPPFDGEA